MVNSNDNDRQFYERVYRWMAERQGATRGARESREQFFLRLILNTFFVMFPDEQTDPLRRRYRAKMQVKPGSKAVLMWATGGQKQQRGGTRKKDK